jgi:hypothetical protein
MQAQDRGTVQIVLVWTAVPLLVGGLIALSLQVKLGEGTIGLLGTLLGVVLTSAVTYTNHWYRTDNQLRTARMCVANDLRHWLRATRGQVDDMHNLESSDGNAGQFHTTLPSLRFETDLGHIAVLDTDTSQKLFELIHAKESANGEVAGYAEFVGDAEAGELFNARSAELFLTALQIYKDLCANVGWKANAFSVETEDLMRGEVEKYRMSQIPGEVPFGD